MGQTNNRKHQQEDMQRRKKPGMESGSRATTEKMTKRYEEEFNNRGAGRNSGSNSGSETEHDWYIQSPHHPLSNTHFPKLEVPVRRQTSEAVSGRVEAPGNIGIIEAIAVFWYIDWELLATGWILGASVRRPRVGVLSGLGGNTTYEQSVLNELQGSGIEQEGARDHLEVGVWWHMHPCARSNNFWLQECWV
ncbi:uncharacterized protein EI90DRAFT_3014018 [Cantharellus anzutake]|uniref:uncharacterized protein n=1 Tax=Cantharellus anzutake TaxID=1750568 RepID=UPI0019079C2C|nr:uncharacterized protein EI90DRAFT_3014018 [Cantharellus anzutake]KAF8337074.1 hypothetical protein EI90DRAFT_3014018 [Cantharellus anzutake]